MFRNKLIYTLIDIVNRRIMHALGDRKDGRERVSVGDGLHPYIVGQLRAIVVSGVRFCLELIGKLEDMSGDWQCFSTG